MLGELEARSGRVIVADLEAGVGTVSRLGPGEVDRLLLIVEPQLKSIETARRARAIAAEREIRDVVVVANRIANRADLDHVRRALPDVPVVEVPDDQAIREADREGRAPVDHDPGAPAVTAIDLLARRLGSLPG